MGDYICFVHWVLHHLDTIVIDIMTNEGNICYQNLQDNEENCYINCFGSHHFLLASYHERNYFLMMGSFAFQMKLYDLRLLQRGAVQCYEGHVNSHTRIQMGVDPSERFVMSGRCCFSDVIYIAF